MRSRLSQLTIVSIPTYASDLDAPLPPGPRFRLRVKKLEPRRHRMERVLNVGNWLFGAISRIEKNWRTEVLAGQTPYDPAEAVSIREYYEQWAMPCRRCLDEIQYLEAKGIWIEGADEFKRHCDEATDILAGDNPFFDDAERAGHWAAIAARHRAPCRPVQVDEDGRIFESDGERFNMPGLTPADIQEAFEDERVGRMRPLKEIVASRNQHGI